MTRKSATVQCPCGWDSGLRHLGSSYNVGDESKRLGMAWIMLQDGGSVWICRTCEKAVNEAAVRISTVLGSEYWVASSVLPRSGETR
jgi:hypothetical protein